MTERSPRGRQWLEEVLRLMGLPARVAVSDPETSDDPTSCWLIIEESDLTPEQRDALIGEGGTAIDALQYLANTLLNLDRPEESRQPYTIELGGYRERRREQLRALADEVARRARETGRESETESLSAAERRQVHHFLKAHEDLETYSRGSEPNRHVVARPREAS